MQNLYVTLTILTIVALTTYIITWAITFSRNAYLFHGEVFEFQDRNSCIISPLKNIDDFLKYLSRRNGICKHLEILGGTASSDSSRFVCFQRKFKFQNGSCSVLSFGIDDDLIFEEDIAKFGCEVYVFDPVSSKLTLKKGLKIFIFSLGLSDFTGWKNNVGLVDTYKNILVKLNLIGKTIDYLKVDILGSESEFLENVLRNSPKLLKYVKQIGMEIYVEKPKEPIVDQNLEKYRRLNFLWKNIQKLECLGFKMVSTRGDEVTSIQKTATQNIRFQILYINDQELSNRRD